MSNITKLIAVLEEEIKHYRETYIDDPFMTNECHEGFIEGLDYARWIANKLYQRDMVIPPENNNQEAVKEKYNSLTRKPWAKETEVNDTNVK